MHSKPSTRSIRRPRSRQGAAPQPRLSTLAQALLGCCLLGSGAVAWPQVLPVGPQVVHGQASVLTQGAQMTVRNTPGAIVNWQSFSIGAGAGVYFDQVNAASKVLNRVVGNDPSQIMGSLGSNGQVWLLNQHGVLFGRDARVDVAGLVASTLRLGDADFINGQTSGRWRFTAADGSASTLRNEGTLQSSFGGHVVMLGTRVENTGSISAPGGQVALAAANSVDLVDTALPNIAVRVDVPAGEVLNLGRLMADGGRVDVHAAIVNQQGLVQASSLGVDANGHIVLHAADTLLLGEASHTAAVGSMAGSSGGQVDLLGAQVGVLGEAVVDVSGVAGGGGIRLGGGRMGQDSSVPNARAVYFGPEATLRADGTEAGSGGSIVLWSNEATRAYGSISARGAGPGGNGGFAETSGGWLDARLASLDLRGPQGRGGTWLLDPNDIYIVGGDFDNNISDGPIFTSADDSAVLSVASIAGQLDQGVSVRVVTANAGSNSEAGDILMIDANLNVNPPEGVSLTLEASRDIIVRNSSITSAEQPLSLEFISAGSGVGVIEIDGSSIVTRGGNVLLRGAGSYEALLPDGSFALLDGNNRPAVGYGETGWASQATFNTSGVAIIDSTLNLGSGTLQATGLATSGFSYAGVYILDSSVQARDMQLWGLSDTFNGLAGIRVEGNIATLDATRVLSLRGSGERGVHVLAGARVQVLGSAEDPLARLALDGHGLNSGVAIWDASLSVDEGGPYRGTPVRVEGARLEVLGRTESSVPAIDLYGGFGLGLPAAPSLDLAEATEVLFASSGGGEGGFGGGINLWQVRVAGPINGGQTTTLQADNDRIYLFNSAVTGAGSIEFSAPLVSFIDSSITSSGLVLNLAFATTGSAPEGVSIFGSSIATGGGNVVFGAEIEACLPVLGCTSGGTWVQSTGSLPALALVDTVLDAGSGTITGGGSALAERGVQLAGSTLQGSSVDLTGRSDSAIGLQVAGGSYSADRELRLTGLTASGSFSYATDVGDGSSLQINDPEANPGSTLQLRGIGVATGRGVILSGGLADTSGETRITAVGGSLLISGSSAIGGDGLTASGSGESPGLIIDAQAATTARLEGSVDNGLGRGLTLSNVQVLGPQTVAEGTVLEIVGNGLQTGEGTELGTRIGDSAISSASPVLIEGAQGLAIWDSVVTGNAGLTASSANGPLDVLYSTLRADGPGAQLRLEGASDAPATGNFSYLNGTGIILENSTLGASGAGGQIAINGQGSASGGHGVELIGSALAAAQVEIDGQAQVLGDGVRATPDVEFLSGTTISATDLRISGYGADTSLVATQVGVRLLDGTQISLVGGGNALIEGDTVLLGTGGESGISISGDAAVLQVLSSGSMRLVGALLDFSSGLGTDITLRGDADATGVGRVRLEDSTLLSGGGDISIRGIGVYGLDPDGQTLPQNFEVLEGAAGVILLGNNTLNAGSGTVTLTGTGATDGRPDNPDAAGSWGVFVEGISLVQGGSIQIDADGGDKGHGLYVGLSELTTRLNLSAQEIRVAGTGRGLADGDFPFAGVVVADPSNWNAGSGLLNIGAPNGGIIINGPDLAGGSVLISASAGGIDLSNVDIQATGAIQIDASTSIGNAVELGNVDLLTPGAVNIVGIADSSARGIQLNVTNQLVGGSLNLDGRSSGGVGLQANGFSGSLQATDGVLRVAGEGGDHGVNLTGAWALQAATELWVSSNNGLTLGFQGEGSPTFSAALLVDVAIDAPAGLTVGAAFPLNAAALNIALEGLAGSATTLLRLGSGQALSVAAAIEVPSRLVLQADTLTLAPGSSLISAAAGDAVVLRGAGSDFVQTFTNNAGASAISSPAGRWVLLVQAPAQTTLGGLDPAFSAYGLASSPWERDASGNYLTPGSGNALGFAVTLQDLTGESLAGKVTRQYDATASILLSPDEWTFTGLLPGHTLQASSLDGFMDDKNVGLDKPVFLLPDTSINYLDADNRPVFGYEAPQLAADITPAPLLVLGTQVNNKVYDGNTNAVVQSAGNITALGTDDVSLGAGAIAVFIDKNVGIDKSVLVSGLSLEGVDAGNYIVQAPLDVVADIAPLALSISGLLAVDKVYDATTLATLSGEASIAPIEGDSVSLLGSPVANFDNKNVGIDKPVSVSGFVLDGIDAGNYTLEPVSELSASISALEVIVSGLLAENKVYDATTLATLSGLPSVSLLDGDDAALEGTAAGQFADKNVGIAKPVAVTGLSLIGTDAGNYVLVAPAELTADISPLDLSLAGLTANNKVYDGTTVATLNGEAGLTPLPGDDVVLLGAGSASFDDKNVGTGKTVTVIGLSLGGDDAGNYTLLSPPDLTADITPLSLAISGLLANDKVYDATTLATLSGEASIAPVEGDEVSLLGFVSASFGDKNVGVDKPVTVTGLFLDGPDAGNYTLEPVSGLSAEISALQVVVSGLSAANKVYDATTTATLNGDPGVALLEGDDAALTGTLTGQFADKNVGIAKPVAVTGLSLTGADAGNYVLVAPAALTADISPLDLSLAGLSANNKVYDGTTVATLNGDAGFNPLPGDDVQLLGAGSASFVDKNVGISKTVTIIGLSLGGDDAGNYTLLSPPDLTADITPLTLPLLGLSATSKTYDGTDEVELDGSPRVDPLGDDSLQLLGAISARFSDKNVGIDKPVIISGLSLGGADAGNYSLDTSIGLNADISALEVQIMGLSALNKVYDATTAALLTGTPLVDLLEGDDAALVGTLTGQFLDKNVGLAKPVAATGLSLTGADASNYVLVAPAELTADISPLTLSLAGLTANNKVYDGTPAATLNGDAGFNPLPGDDVQLLGAGSASFADKNVGTSKTVTIIGLSLGGDDAGNYTLLSPPGLSADITPLALPVFGLVALDKIYDASSAATLSGAPQFVPLEGDSVLLSGVAAGSFVDKNVGVAKPVTLSGLSLAGTDGANYTLVAPSDLTASITPLDLALTGLSAANKVYDGSTAATLQGLAGLNPLPGDDVQLQGASSASFADKNVGVNKPVSVAGLSLGGVDAGNYTLVAPTDLSADITPLALSITGLVADNKGYDGSTAATLSGSAGIAVLDGDDLQLLGTSAASFGDKNVGLGKAVTVSGYALAGADAGNYTLLPLSGLTADITPLELAVSGLLALSKVYDADTLASLIGTATVEPIEGDDVSLAGAAVGAFADKNVGVAKPVAVSGLSLGGADAGNYTLVAPTGLVADITALDIMLAGLSANSKAYDGNTLATLSGSASVTPLAGDSLVVQGLASARFADKDVGVGKPVTVTGLILGGADAGNYNLLPPPVLAADITPLALALAGLAAADKVYDANTVAPLTGTAFITPLEGDTVSINGVAAGAYPDKNVGINKPVTVSGLTLTGTDAGNYTLVPPPDLAASITPLQIVLAGLSANNKVYDANTSASLAGSADFTPLAGDSLQLLGTASGSFADKIVGLAKPVTLSGLSLGGADAGNYTLLLPTTLTADITPLALPLAGLTAADKGYDANSTAALTGTASIAPLAGDSVSLAGAATGAFGDKNVGVAKPVAVSGLSLSGADAGNYTLVLPGNLAASITPLDLLLGGLAAQGKVYDAGTLAVLTGTAAVTPLGADLVSLTGVAGGAFTDKNVGSNKAVSVSGLTLAGVDAGNYTLVAPGNLLADITPLQVAATGLLALGKVYDAGTAAALAGTASVTPIAGDQLSLSGVAVGNFADKNVGLAKPVAVGGLSLTGADAGNYLLAPVQGLSADITPAPVSVAGVNAASRAYDGTTAATLTGTATVAALGADQLQLAGTPDARFADPNVGQGKPVTVSGYTLAGTDAGNYLLSQPAGLSADIAQALLTLGGLTAADKVYDGNTSVSLNAALQGVLSGETVVLGLAGAFADPNAGSNKRVDVTAQISGAGAANYTLGAGANTSVLAAITPAPLLYLAAAAEGVSGAQLPSLTGTVTGFIGNETLASATTGALVWTTPATPASPAGSYAIIGSGLAALNYSFSQAEFNASALTLGPPPPNTGGDDPSAGTQVNIDLALQSVMLPVLMSTPSQNRVLDLMQGLDFKGGSTPGALLFGALNLSQLTREQTEGVLAARSAHKKQVFSSTLSQLEQDPTLADVRPCENEAEVATGACLITDVLKQEIQSKAARAQARSQARQRVLVRDAPLPRIERKLALLVGINQYTDKRVPELSGAVPDVRAVRTVLEQRLGYETVVIEDAGRDSIVRAFNQLALEADANDSVIIYYAGHGIVVPAEGNEPASGYWIPADADAERPRTWLSNADISRLVTLISARQVMLVSDSCYSGSLAGTERVQVSSNDPADLLSRRAAVVMSSGGDEPVADEGRNGHSVFAWHLMETLKEVANWQTGGELFQRIRTEVVKDFPQTPQYGAARTAGHQGNTDYLVERRVVEVAQP